MADQTVKRTLELLLSGKYGGSQWLNSFTRDLDTGSRKLHDAFVWKPATGEWVKYKKAVGDSEKSVSALSSAQARLATAQNTAKGATVTAASAQERLNKLQAGGKATAGDLAIAQDKARLATDKLTAANDRLHVATAKADAALVAQKKSADKAATASSRWTTLNSTPNRILGTAGKFSTYAGVGALALAGDNAYKAATYQRLVQQAQATTVMSDREAKYMSNQVLKTAQATGANPADLLDAYTRAVNLRYHYGTATGLMDIAIKSALPTGANVGDTASSLDTTLRTFGIDPSKAKATMDTLHMGAAKANIVPAEFGSFMQNWGRIGLFAGSVDGKKINGLPGFMDQALATYATIVHGVGPDLGATQFINLVQRIMNPSKSAKGDADTPGTLAWYYAHGKNQAQRNLYGDFSYWGLKNKGLPGIIKDLRDSGLDPGQMAKIIPNLRAAAINQLTGHQYAGFVNTYQSLGGAPSQQVTATLWKKYLTTTFGQYDRLKQQKNVAQIRGGQNMLPVITGLENFINSHFGAAAGLIQSAPGIATGAFIGRELLGFGAKRGLGNIFGKGASTAGTAAKDIEAIAKAAKDADQPVKWMIGNFGKLGPGLETAAGATSRFTPLLRGIGTVSKIIDPEIALIPTAFQLAFLDSDKQMRKWGYDTQDEIGAIAHNTLIGGRNIATSLVSGIESKGTDVLHAGSTILGDIGGWIGITSDGTNKHGDNVVTWGSHLGSGFASGLKGEIPNLKTVASNALDAVGHWLHFGSPNPAGDDPFVWGGNLGKGYKKGLKAQEPAVTATAKAIAASAIAALDQSSAAKAAGQDMVRHYFDGMYSVDPSQVANNPKGWAVSYGPNAWKNTKPYSLNGTSTAPPPSFWGGGFSPATSNRVESGNAYMLPYTKGGVTAGQLGDTDYPSGGKAQEVFLPGGASANYKVIQEFWNPDTGGHVVLRTPNRGTITLAHMSTMTGMPGNEWNRQPGPSSLLGKTVTGGTFMGMSGAPITNAHGNTPGYYHLCIQTDPSGRQYLAWLTTDQMNQQASGSTSAVNSHTIGAVGSSAQGNLKANWGLITTAAKKYNIDPYVLAGMALQESGAGTNPKAKGQYLGEATGTYSWPSQTMEAAHDLRYWINWAKKHGYKHPVATALAIYNQGVGGMYKTDPTGTYAEGPDYAHVVAVRGNQARGMGLDSSPGSTQPNGPGAPKPPKMDKKGKPVSAQATADWWTWYIKSTFGDTKPSQMDPSTRALYKHDLYARDKSEEQAKIDAANYWWKHVAGKDPSLRKTYNQKLDTAKNWFKYQWKKDYTRVDAGPGSKSIDPAYATHAAKANWWYQYIGATFGDVKPEWMNPKTRALYKHDEWEYLNQSRLAKIDDANWWWVHVAGKNPALRNVYNLKLGTANNQFKKDWKKAYGSIDAGPIKASVWREKFDLSTMKYSIKGEKPSTLVGQAAQKWLDVTYKIDEKTRQIADQQAKIAYMQGEITKQQYKDRLTADNAAKNTANQNARAKLNGGPYGPSNHVVPVKEVGKGICPEIKKQHATLKDIAGSVGHASARAADNAALVARKQRDTQNHHAKRTADEIHGLREEMKKRDRVIEQMAAALEKLLTGGKGGVSAAVSLRARGHSSSGEAFA